MRKGIDEHVPIINKRILYSKIDNHPVNFDVWEQSNLIVFGVV